MAELVVYLFVLVRIVIQQILEGFCHILYKKFLCSFGLVFWLIRFSDRISVQVYRILSIWCFKDWACGWLMLFQISNDLIFPWFHSHFQLFYFGFVMACSLSISNIINFLDFLTKHPQITCLDWHERTPTVRIKRSPIWIRNTTTYM